MCLVAFHFLPLSFPTFSLCTLMVIPSLALLFLSLSINGCFDDSFGFFKERFRTLFSSELQLCTTKNPSGWKIRIWPIFCDIFPLNSLLDGVVLKDLHLCCGCSHYGRSLDRLFNEKPFSSWTVLFLLNAINMIKGSKSTVVHVFEKQKLGRKKNMSHTFLPSSDIYKCWVPLDRTKGWLSQISAVLHNYSTLLPILTLN